MLALPHHRPLAAALALALCLTGCTSVRDYVRNGFKVGCNYCPPQAPVAKHWIDADDLHIRENSEIPCQWWSVFEDPVLDRLVDSAYHQNLSLREAGFRILQARAELAITRGNLFPQLQDMTGSYQREATSLASSNPRPGARQFFDQWNAGFNLAWELDFWGRFRRAVDAAEDTLDASVADYDDVLVTLLGDVAANYLEVRTDQERIRLLRENESLQRGVLEYVEKQYKAGFRVSELDLSQARSTLSETSSYIPQLEIDLRQSANRLCTLLGMPARKLDEQLGIGPIPTAPPEIAVGLPAELLRRRPDVRRAERLAAAQAEAIGIAQAEFYPIITVSGTLGWQAASFSRLFSSRALNGAVGPSFQWNLLNYGRLTNNVRFQDARFQELVAAYQDTVLRAGEEVENGLVTFLRAKERARLLEVSVENSKKAVVIVISQYEAGKKEVDFNRYALIAQDLVRQQDLLAQARGQIALGLIQVYRALGGGWELRCQPELASPAPAPPASPFAPEEIPPPAPLPGAGPAPSQSS